jgi:hypothetical protein
VRHQGAGPDGPSVHENAGTRPAFSTGLATAV